MPLSVRRLLVLAAAMLAGAALLPQGYALAQAAVQSVLVTNTAALPVPVATAKEIRTPTAVRLQVGMQENQVSGTATFTVPAGRQYVLETASALGVSGNIERVELTNSSTVATAQLLTKAVNSGGYRWQSGSTPILMVVPAGKVITVRINRTAATNPSCSPCATQFNYITLNGWSDPL